MRLISAILVVLAAALVMPAQAQDKPASNMEIVREKLRADKKLLVAAEMKLTEGEAKGFWPVYDAYQKVIPNLSGPELDVVPGSRSA